MDMDALHHYFYFYDTDLEEDDSRAVSPSEDIWKKFELVPSPRASSAWSSGGHGVMAPLGVELGWDLSSPVKGSGPWAGALTSMVLLRDCMWSGFQARECLEKVLGERLSPVAPKVHLSPKLESDIPVTAADVQKSAAVHPSSNIPATAAEIPKPAAARPSLNVPVTASDVSKPAAAPPIPLLVPKTEPLSGSDSPSDSDDDDIDVVTVGQRRKRKQRKPVTITVRADLLDPCTAHFHISIHQQQHNYAARYPPEPSPLPPPDPVVQVKVEDEDPPSSPLETMSTSDASCFSPFSPKEGRGSSSCSGTSGSDGEERVKKKNHNHNYMERKRRYDLRSRFLALRDEVPGLARTSKPPKVVILSEATTFLHSLISRERRLALEKRQLQARQRQLIKLILRLKAK